MYLRAMNRELDALMQPAGFRIIWRGASDPPSAAGAEHLVMVELRGICTASVSSMASTPLSSPVPLASSSVADGQVLPFSWLDCTALEPLPRAGGFHVTRKPNKMTFTEDPWRACWRMSSTTSSAQTDDHTPAGIAKARFSTADLLADHFDFETVALERLRRPALLPVRGSDDASGGGR